MTTISENRNVLTQAHEVYRRTRRRMPTDAAEELYAVTAGFPQEHGVSSGRTIREWLNKKVRTGDDVTLTTRSWLHHANGRAQNP